LKPLASYPGPAALQKGGARFARTLIPVAFLLIACGDGNAPDPEVQAADAVPGAEATESGPAADPADTSEIFERELIFISAEADSTLHLPWSFRSRIRESRVERLTRAWLARAGAWEILVLEEAETPAAGSPWRILPGASVRLIVGEDDRLDLIGLREGARPVETRIDDFISEWARPGIEPVRLFEGRTSLASGEVEGFVLEVNRRWTEPGGEPGDWIFLHAGSGLQFFMEEDRVSRDPIDARPYRGWSRLAFQVAQWDGLSVEWGELRPFEPARRDIPSEWTLSTPGHEVVGSLRATSSHFAAGEGEGPILPLSGFFEVEGEISIRGEVFEVAGIIRHRQR
jgi:hypothetical protein